MAKGAESKALVTKKILEIFEGAFEYNKELRIPLIEGGEQVQIKVTLTCAKENVECGMDNATPGDFPASPTQAPTPTNTTPIAPTDEEKQRVSDLMKMLGL